jgi:hypothetical protein
MPTRRKKDEVVGVRFCSFAAAAQRTGLSETVLRDAARRGALRVYRPSPGRLLIDIDELDAWVLSTRQPVAAGCGKQDLDVAEAQ